MLDIRRLGTILLGVSIGLITIGLAISNWRCGNLFEGCQHLYDSDMIISVAALLVIGVVCLAIVFVLDILGARSSTFAENTGYLTARFVLLYLGAACTLIAVIVYTVKVGHEWSYFITVVGTVIAVHIALLALLHSRCTRGTVSST
ncbi:unnamed protein product [Dicrocoelium dendriticum]|nr:unnamed protein product [Dicrocoelium dendriticum]